ncbi:MAG: hypothetical protein H6908_00240 [Hyphomicrobiales bacterium]|nr:hypothetical protein [Rickettsiales bacterium]MCP5361060.1 hypothetical protein [Hyphomicrobiales bacterium]
MKRPVLFSLLGCMLLNPVAHAEEPALPMGLGVVSPADVPALPQGLSSEPSLPMGLGDGNKEEAVAQERADVWRDALPFDLSGFIETRYGMRLHRDTQQKRASLGEGRLHLQALQSNESLTVGLSGDLLYDPVADEYEPDLENGDGVLDVREAYVLFRPAENADVKLGRQILTWGTGDLLFINDLFPKDWNSFFIGRDVEYLKAPSDAVKLAFYHPEVNLDVVYTPRFDADRFIDGRRISYYNAGAGSVAGRNLPVNTEARDGWFHGDELALRLHRLVEAYETALYYYQGYWKSPAGQNPLSGRYTFPRLSVYGASVRGPVLAGIANAELGYYDSRDDRRGVNPLVRNSEWRVLVGYEQELVPELTGSMQYYIEHMQDHTAYRQSLPAGAVVEDANHQVLTLRLTQLLMQQNLKLSLFNFYSPSAGDGYTRASVNYKLDDHWQLETGLNLFYGQRHTSFFGQFEDTSNIYAGVRYSF